MQLAYSPCPNDTWIFAAWTQGFLPAVPPVNVVLDDVEALNRAAQAARYELTKVSYGAIPMLLPDYRILRAGGALGRGCGPLLVRRSDAAPITLSELSREALIAIPGQMTTAFLLLQLALGYRPRVLELRFDQILPAVAAGTVDAGLIIHESRFTYAAAGLEAIIDLGSWWETHSGHPIPLGAILIRRDVSDTQAQAINTTIRASLRYAQTHPDAVMPYVRDHAQEMDEAVMRAHIDLYVTPYTDDLGSSGEAAIGALFKEAATLGLIQPTQPEFVG